MQHLNVAVFSLHLSVHRHRRHGPGPAGRLPHCTDQKAGRRRTECRAGCRLVSLLEDPAGQSEGESAGSEPLGAQPQGSVLEGGSAGRRQPWRRGKPRWTNSSDGAGAGQNRTGEVDLCFSARFTCFFGIKRHTCFPSRTLSLCVWSWTRPRSTR